MNDDIREDYVEENSRNGANQHHWQHDIGDSILDASRIFFWVSIFKGCNKSSDGPDEDGESTNSDSFFGAQLVESHEERDVDASSADASHHREGH